MTKNQFVEIVKRNLDGGDSPAELRSRYHEREIELYISMAFDAVLNRKENQTKELSAELGRDSWKWDALTKAYTLDILQDTTRDRFYSVLPVNVLSVVNNNGIRMVCPTKEEASTFFPRWQLDTFLMDGLDVGLMTGLIYFTLEGDKIYYSGDIDCNWKTVLAKLVLKFSEFDDTDEINIPEGKDMEIITMAMQLLQAKQPMDIIADSTAIQTTK